MEPVTPAPGGEEAALEAAHLMPSGRGPLHRLYDWVLSWGHSPYGVLALFLVAFAESSFFPVPPDVLIITLTLGRPGLWFRFASISTIGSVLGGVLGYLIGYAFFDLFGERIIESLHIQEQFAKGTALLNEYGFLAILTAALTPIPYKVFTIGAGVAHMSLIPFVAASIIGRGFRFYLVGWIVHKFGPPALKIIDRYLVWITIGVTALFILGFVAWRLVKG